MVDRKGLGLLSIRWRIGLILAGLLALYAVADLGVQRFILAPHFAKLEQDAADADMARALRAQDNELHHLSTMTTDNIFPRIYRLIPHSHLPVHHIVFEIRPSA